MVKRFDRKANTAIIIFFCTFAYYVYVQGLNILAVVAYGVLAVFWFGFTQRYYTIEKRDLVVHYFLRKDRHFPIMDMNSITEPAVSLFRFPLRGSIDIFMQDGKRICVVPKERVTFLKTLERVNKRIFIQVPEYSDTKKNF